MPNQTNACRKACDAFVGTEVRNGGNYIAGSCALPYLHRHPPRSTPCRQINEYSTKHLRYSTVSSAARPGRRRARCHKRHWACQPQKAAVAKGTRHANHKRRLLHKAPGMPKTKDSCCKRHQACSPQKVAVAESIRHAYHRGQLSQKAPGKLTPNLAAAATKPAIRQTLCTYVQGLLTLLAWMFQRAASTPLLETSVATTRLQHRQHMQTNDGQPRQGAERTVGMNG
eukprot:1144729-Pelagomonas_calceolata.AAC.3